MLDKDPVLNTQALRSTFIFYYIFTHINTEVLSDLEWFPAHKPFNGARHTETLAFNIFISLVVLCVGRQKNMLEHKDGGMQCYK